MKKFTRAIFFDIGGTLVEKDRYPEPDLAVIENMRVFLAEPGSARELVDKVTLGEAKYKAWRNSTMVELTPEEKWSRYLLRDHPGDFIVQHAKKLQAWWSESRGRKWVEAETIQILKELKRRGYLLGTISHTSPIYLKDAGLSEIFSVMLHSAEVGKRKPDPSLFLDAARKVGVEPQYCAYVGDRPSRDVIGPREAGIGTVVYLNKNDANRDTLPCPMKPDLEINQLSQLLEYFPMVTETGTAGIPNSVGLYDIALSTMWWQKNSDSAESFFTRGRSLEFARFELNHQIPFELFEQIDLNRFSIGSLHDPCPAFVPNKKLELADVQITSLDEDRRKLGVEVVKRTIMQAYKLGSRMIVIHPGRIAGDHSLDDRLRQLYREGKKGNPEYMQLQERLILDRVERGKPHLEQLIKSLQEITHFAEDKNMRLGLENRFHYYELPIYEEMKVILDAFQQPWVGWQFDLGHLRVLGELGLMSMQHWLDDFSARIVGVHIHDVKGILDHRAPGAGDLDFISLARHIPENAYRTLEVDPSVEESEIQQSLEFLCKIGFIQRI